MILKIPRLTKNLRKQKEKIIPPTKAVVSVDPLLARRQFRPSKLKESRVKYTVRCKKSSLGIAQTGTHSVPFNRGSETGHPGTTSAAVIDLSGHSQRPKLEAIAGSEVSVASTQSKNETGENQNSFARMMRSTGAVNPGQTFANVQ